MVLRAKLMQLYRRINTKYREQFGFNIKETNFGKIVDYLHRPTDASSLAATRILFGVCMLLDIPQERGGAVMERRWGDPNTCHFPLLPFVRALPMPYMSLVYAAMWIGAACMSLGYRFQPAAALYAACHWYLLLVDKSFWNNHSYLFGLVAFLFTFTQANSYWSLDALLHPSLYKDTVPYWNYFILKYQFVVLYFMAGVMKGSAEWLSGHSMRRLSDHWVFAPFRLLLTPQQVDHLIVHWFIFVFDLTVAFWMMWTRTRPAAMMICVIFHLMNSRLFQIGMFPWVCLATMPLFCPFDWPKTTIQSLNCYYTNLCCFPYKRPVKALETTILEDDKKINKKEITDKQKDHIADKENKTCDEKNIMHKEDFKENAEKTTEENINLDKRKETKDIVNLLRAVENFSNNYIKYAQLYYENTEARFVERRRKLTTVFIFIYCFIQAFLPFSHFLTKGYNNWTNGLYGYSWDMMVHNWDATQILINVVDNQNNQSFAVNNDLYTLNDRWTRHGDMLHQYAQFLKKRIPEQAKELLADSDYVISDNISVYADIWYSLNGRFSQRMFDSKVDLTKVTWSPFKRMSYLMPLLDDAVEWRKVLDDLREEVYSWSEFSDVLFLADFPGYELQKFVPSDFENVTLTILHGLAVYEPLVKNGQSQLLNVGDSVKIDSGEFHQLSNIGHKPAYYMYTFNNSDKQPSDGFSPTLHKELYRIYNSTAAFAEITMKSLYLMFFRMPVSMIM